MLTSEKRVLCANPLQRFGSGLEPDQEPTREMGPVANTNFQAEIEWTQICTPGCHQASHLVAKIE